MLQGGGMGILGDFLFSPTNRFGGGWTATVAGPTASDLETIASHLFIDGFKEVAFGDKTMQEHFGAKGARLLKQWTPYQLWYVRTVMERAIFDNINKIADPKWHEKQRRAETRMRKKGQEYWWKPGESAPTF